MNLKQKTIHSFKWLFLARVSQKALSFGTFIVLARILEPKDFGLFAMAFVVIDGLGMFQSLGIDSALIQRKDNVERAANTAFFIFPVVGIMLFIILSIFAPFVSYMLKAPNLTPVIRVLGFLYIIKCFSRVPSTLYVKELNFKTKTIIEMTAEIFNSTVAITLAFFKFGVWSLVYAYLAKQLITFIGFWKFCPWRPKLEFDIKIAKELIHFGKFVFGAGLIWFLVGNLDRAIIGRLLGMAMLGYYALAYNIANLTSTHLTGLLYQVMFPAYSKIQDDKERMKEVFLKTIKYVSLISIPFCVGVIILAPDFLRIVYGDKWLPSVGVLRVLAIAGLLRSLNVCIGPIFIAVGKPKMDLKLGIYQIFTLGMLLYPLTKFYGLIGAGIAILISYSVLSIFEFKWGMRILNVKLYLIFKKFEPAINGSILIIFLVFLFYSIPWKMNIHKLISVIFFSILGYLVYILLKKEIRLSIIKSILS